MADQTEVDLDSIIDRLLEVRGSRPGKQVQLLESEIRFLCTKAREIFISQPILLELEAPIKVCSPTSPDWSRVSCAPLRQHYLTRFRFVEISMDSTMTYYGCSNTAVSLPRQTTSSSATTWIVESNP
jgi:hypothetical protein